MIYTDENGCQHCEATTWGQGAGQWGFVMLNTKSDPVLAYSTRPYEDNARVRLFRASASSEWRIVGPAESFWRLLDDPLTVEPRYQDENRASGAIDTDPETGEQFAEAIALADIARGETGPVQLDGSIEFDCACACSCSIIKGARIDLYRPSASHEWHIAGIIE